jgi:hypothetical protein
VIKQFNFYDIYGYLLPGLLVVFLFWLPAGLITQSWPSDDISKGIFFIVLAYIVGHLLRTLGHAAIPSTDRGRYPSDRLLDQSDSRLPASLKSEIRRQSGRLFRIVLRVDCDGDKGEISGTRNATFYLARSYLIANKAAQYAEQFEGLYAMMRSFACAFLIACCYFLGWDLALLAPTEVARGLAVVSILFAIIAVGLAWRMFLLPRDAPPIQKDSVSRWLAVSLLILGFLSGFWSAVWQPSVLSKAGEPEACLVLLASAGASSIAAAQCFSAYREFADEFAKTVWRDFAAFASSNAGKASSSGS